MAGEPARHLRPVESPEDIIRALKEANTQYQQIVKGLEHDIKGWAIRYGQLAEDRAEEAREHPLFPLGKRLFDGWRRRCNHPRAQWSEDRFWLCEPFLMLPRYAPDLEGRVLLVCRAIAGAAYDSWTVKRRNGSVKRMDEWHRIFSDPRQRRPGPSAGSFEEFCNRAPMGWQPVLSDEMRALIVEAERRLALLKESK